MIDLHVHTARCGHASGTLEEYIARARAAGVATMAFTDHLPMPEGYPQHYTMHADEVRAYVAEVRAEAVVAAVHGGPEVLCGIEADWLPDHVAWTKERLSELDLDVVLGSVHFIGGWAFDDPSLINRYSTWRIDELWARYFSDLADAARSGLFDVMAHPDLVKKFGYIPDVDPTSWYEEAASAIQEAGCAIEVSTAGLRKPVAQIYPSLEFLRICHRRGIPATTASDAHAPDEVGRGLDEARALLREAGYESLVVYRDRAPSEVAL